jgi:cyclopropane-fatty-acyl-phospholipid synthase
MWNSKVIKLSVCPVCLGGAIEQIVHMPDYPFTEKFAEAGSTYSSSPNTGDQALLFCSDCSHCFLQNQYDPENLYHSGYQTISSRSQAAVDATRRLLAFANSICPLPSFDLLFDIGANDGTLLNQASNLGFVGLKVALDPSFSSWEEDVQGHTSFVEDFDFSLLPRVSGNRLFIASHVLEHIADPRVVVATLSANMRSGDLMVLQFPALEPLVLERRFDQIHHQHFHYFSWESLLFLAQEAGLSVVSSQVDWAHYGAGNVAFEKTVRFEPQEAPSVLPWGSPDFGRLGKISIENAVAAHAEYVSFQRVLEHMLSERTYVALGAGLMSPIVFYHVKESWNNCKAIFDEDQAKVGLRYENTPGSIQPLPRSLAGEDVLITGSVSRDAGRRLFNVAAGLNARSVNFPVLNF